MNKTNKIRLTIIIVFFAVLLCGLVYGSFNDLAVSKKLFDDTNFYGIFFASFGELPCWTLLGVAGTIFFKYFYKDETKWKKILMPIFGVICIIFSVVMIYFCESSSFNKLINYIPTYVMIIIAIIIETAIVLLTIKFANNDNKDLVIRVAFTFFLACASEMILINIFKFIWSRPRYRLIYDGGTLNGQYYSVDILFRSWFQPGSGIAKEIWPLAKSDQFKSFPSGHSGDAVTSMLFFFLPLLNKKTCDKKYLQYINIGVAIVWSILVLISRIVIGAHYLTDVTMGAMLSLICGYLCSYFLIERTRKEDKNVQVS